MKKIAGIVLIVVGIISFFLTIINGYKYGFGKPIIGQGISGSLSIAVLGILLYIDAL